jgi:hypothetical protein
MKSFINKFKFNMNMSQKILKNKKKTILIILLFLIIGGIFFSYGFLSYHYKIIPYNFISKIHTTLIQYTTEEPPIQSVNELITIDNEKDILNKRNELIKYIWKNEEIPNFKMPEIIKNVSDERYSSLQNLKQIDKLTIEMEHKISSIMYHFQSSNPNNKLIIYHQGHRGDFIQGKEVIQEFLDNGYDVIAISMPLLGLNNQPEIELERFGKVKLTKHDHFKFIDNNNFSSIKFFIEPVIVALNYAEESGVDDIYMTGISGGGWTTVLSAAIDERISKSYPVAGSYPIYIRFSHDRDWGDYEQIEPNLYRIANYLELYIMASYGEKRKHTQILNLYDSCCFAGEGYLTYKDIIYQKIENLEKGNFEIFIDQSHSEHKISKKVLKFIMNDLK